MPPRGAPSRGAAPMPARGRGAAPAPAPRGAPPPRGAPAPRGMPKPAPQGTATVPGRTMTEQSSPKEEKSKTEKPETDKQEEGFECRVCFTKGTNVRATKCGHICCEECYQAWFVQGNQKRCPMCNTPVELNEVIKLFI